LNEEYIIKKINDFDLKKYSVLRTYLEYHKNPKKEKNKYLLDNLHIFNSALNLICQKYFKKISKGNAIKIRLKEVQIYKENNELFDKFIEFYNNVVIDDLNIKDKLSIDNPLIDFFITDDNRYGRTYKIIYKKCIDLQNNMIINILKEKGIFDTYNQNRYKIQQLDENQIFSLNLPKNTSLIDVLFSSSYRKIIFVPMIDMDCESYDEYVINYDYIEEEMSELLLYHKKLLNEDIIEFAYNDELFTNQIIDLLTKFKRYYYDTNISHDDKKAIYRFYMEIRNNIILNKRIIKDFFCFINIPQQ
jgi:hypothetical protein